MKMKKSVLVMTISFMLIFSLAGTVKLKAELTPDQILQKNENLPSPPGTSGTMKMILISKNGQERTRNIKSYSKKYPDGTEKRVIIFIGPPDVKNVRFLTISYKGSNKEDEQYIYIPALRKIRSIGVRGGKEDKTGAFLGSDFTYADMGDLKINDFNSSLLGIEKVMGQKCYKIEMKAKNDEVVKKYGYSKLIKWINANDFTSCRTDYYDRNGTLFKRLLIEDPYKLGGKYWFFKKMEMSNLETGHKTIFIFEDTKIEDSLSDIYFTMRFLQRGR